MSPTPTVNYASSSSTNIVSSLLVPAIIFFVAIVLCFAVFLMFKLVMVRWVSRKKKKSTSLLPVWLEKSLSAPSATTAANSTSSASYCQDASLSTAFSPSSSAPSSALQPTPSSSPVTHTQPSPIKATSEVSVNVHSVSSASGYNDASLSPAPSPVSVSPSELQPTPSASLVTHEATSDSDASATSSMASDSDNASPPSGEESAPTSPEVTSPESESRKGAAEVVTAFSRPVSTSPVLLCASTSDSTCGSVYTTDCVQDISVKVSPSISLSYSCSTCTVESLDLSRVNEFSSAPRAASPPATAAAAACPESPGISLYESPSTSSSNTSNIDKLAAPLPPSSFNHPVRELSNADENGLGSTNTLDSCGAVINESDHLVPKTFHYIPSGCKAGSSSDLSTTPLNLSSRCPSPLPVSPLPVRAVIVRTPVITGPTPEISKIAYDIPLSAPLPISLPPLPPPPLPPLPIHTIIARHPVITHHDSYLLPEAAKIEILPATSPFFPSGPVRSPTPPAFSALACSALYREDEDTKAGEDTSLPLYSPMPFVHRSPSALSLSFSVYNDQESEDQRHSVHCSSSSLSIRFSPSEVLGHEDQKENTPLLPQSHYQPTPSIRRSPSTVSLCSTKSFRSGLSSLATLPNPHSPRCNRRYRLRVVEPAYYPPWNLYTIYEDREIHH